MLGGIDWISQKLEYLIDKNKSGLERAQQITAGVPEWHGLNQILSGFLGNTGEDVPSDGLPSIMDYLPIILIAGVGIVLFILLLGRK